MSMTAVGLRPKRARVPQWERMPQARRRMVPNQKAAAKLREQAYAGLKNSWELEKVAHSLAGKKVYPTLKIRRLGEDLNGERCQYTVATFGSPELDYVACGAAMLVLRSTERDAARSVYTMALEIQHPEGKGYAWIDCETGEVELSKLWPKVPADKGERRFVLPPESEPWPVTRPSMWTGYEAELAIARKLNERCSALFGASYDTFWSEGLYAAIERRRQRLLGEIAALKRCASKSLAIVPYGGAVLGLNVASEGLSSEVEQVKVGVCHAQPDGQPEGLQKGATSCSSGSDAGGDQ
ncbi:MAG: hypothetical protein JNJ83_11120 [Verrucomicrobiaceae bacterium]|nr:hypothetical protein [Verrucomicrobiaceae bacterium]